MCFDPDSHPPVAPIAGAAVSHEDLVLESADGTRFAAFAAVPDGPPGAGVVLLPDVRGLYGFYEDGQPGAIQRAGEISAPVLALMAGADQSIGPDQVAALEAALEAAGVEHDVVTYPGAPHSFFDRKQEEFASESADAWERTLAFLERHG